MGPVGSIIPDIPEGDFSTEEWTDRVTVLRAAEQMFRRTACESNLRLLSSARWPELRLQRKKAWSTTELRLTLHPSDDRIPLENRRWSINLIRYPRIAWLPLGLVSVETIAVLSDFELRSGDWDQACYQDAVRRLTDC